MATEHVERRLTAILAADIAGYSRLMGKDEEGTLARLKAHRRVLVDRKINEHRGRIVKTTGDGMLVEFASVVEAVRCAVEIQRGMAERNVAVPAEQRIEFRVGINVGDIIIEGTTFSGTASMWRLACKRSRSLAASASRAVCRKTCKASLTLPLRIRRTQAQEHRSAGARLSRAARRHGRRTALTRGAQACSPLWL